jgi:hypothetical protein
VDRFGALPEEVKHLLGVVQIKAYCRRAGIAQVEAGPKGATLAFRGNQFANPAGLVGFINENAGLVKVQRHLEQQVFDRRVLAVTRPGRERATREPPPRRIRRAACARSGARAHDEDAPTCRCGPRQRPRRGGVSDVAAT